MSKITLELDTETKQMSAKLDGAEVTNLTSFYGYKDYNSKGEVERIVVRISTTSKFGDVDVMTDYVAVASAEAQLAEQEDRIVDDKTLAHLGLVGITKARPRKVQELESTFASLLR